MLDADVAVAKPKSGKQNVKIVWHVRRKDGGEIGTVGQENDVPAGLLDGAWGDVAYMVAVSAQDGNYGARRARRAAAGRKILSPDIQSGKKPAVFPSCLSIANLLQTRE